MYKTIILEKREGYAIVTMNRPREMNALSEEMRTELNNALNYLENEETIRVLIMTGGEYVFSAGMDIKEMATLPEEEVAAYFGSILQYLKKIYTYRKPVIDAVGGIAPRGRF